jgi:DNA-binding transcriptional MerR regulator/DNA gyrase inhibitor GyrI
MPLMTISEMTRSFGVTTRMLRYYEAIGLLPSRRIDGYAYRAYDDAAVRRLQQILTLRKLRIPLKKIALIFATPEQAQIIALFQESVSELEQEIEALQTVRDILRQFMVRLNAAAKTHLLPDILADDDLIQVVQTLSVNRSRLKEEQAMSDLNQANEILSTLRDVRVIYLPPCTVAASHYFGDNPEDHAWASLAEYVRSSQLFQAKPDARIYGFNNPSPVGSETYGYEFWVTIPEDFAIAPGLIRKQFAGGLYAAHSIRMGDFQEWQLLAHWIQNNPDYAYDAREPLGMGGSLEEHLNAYSYFSGDATAAAFTQLDLLAPIRPR